MSRSTRRTGDADTLSNRAYREIRKRILDNVWAPGFQALESEVAAELGMSRSPVREAFIQLVDEGLIEVIPRRGFRVLSISATDMKEMYEVIGALESTAAEILAARKPSEAELEPLVQATREMSAALARDDLDAWAVADESFHERLLSMAGNSLLAETVYRYWDRSHRARMFTLRLRPKPVNSTSEHMELVERLRQGDMAGAADVNKEHRRRAGRELLAILERFRIGRL